AADRAVPRRLVAAWKLSRDVPEMETCDMELDSGSRSVKVRDHVLFYSHGLLAGVAGLTMARAARVGREGIVRQTAGVELFLNQQPKNRLGHGGPTRVLDSPRQIHRAPGCQRQPIRKAEAQRRLCAGRLRKR